jgi:hypothetical protein
MVIRGRFVVVGAVVGAVVVAVVGGGFVFVLVLEVGGCCSIGGVGSVIFISSTRSLSGIVVLVYALCSWTTWSFDY